MVSTCNFEVVGELAKSVLQQILEGAWDQSIIPHSVDISPGLAFGPYSVKDGVVNIARAGLSLEMAPADNGLKIKLPSHIQVEINNPPIPSANLFDMDADVFAVVTLGTLSGTINVAALLQGMPRAKVSATLTSGDPIGPIKLSMIQEYVHARYEDGTIPQTYTETGVSYGIFTANVYVMIYDDPSDPAHQILVTQPATDQVKLSIPIYLQLSGISAAAGPQPLSPMGVEARVTLTAPLESLTGSVKAKLSQATVDVESLAPAPGLEGTNYTADKAGAALFMINLDDLLKTSIKARGQAIASAVGDISVSVPTVSQIEGFIADQAHAAIVNRGNIPIWTPQVPEGSEVSVSNVAVKVLSDSLAICMNDMGGADTNCITNFIPAGLSCAINVNGDKVNKIIWDTIHRPESEGGFGPNFPPKTFDNVGGHQAVLNSLSVSLTDGSIHMDGNVTVIDALPCGIDVDADFSADAGLSWEDSAEGGQTIKPYMIGEPDVSLSEGAEILAFFLGFITGGLIGGIIVAIVVAVANGVAKDVGGAVIEDQVTGQMRMLGAWPQQLEGIGTITTRFENPVYIWSDSIVFPDAFLVTAKYALTPDALANANGPYVAAGGSPITITGGPVKPSTGYSWDLGDGSAAPGMVVIHTYADDGIYVSKHTTNVSQPGGSRTREFAKVRVRNVPPHVIVGPDMVVNEGQEVEYIANFTDQEWPDKHRAYFNFGDDSMPAEGSVTETNVAPQAQGSARAKHAYCREGDYTVTVKVIDDDGGVGMASFHVKAKNVPPVVEAGDEMFAYICTPITLVGRFTDPGWCDKHKGYWSFGDCTAALPALVREINQPPAATGIVAATHVYNQCGSFLAECTVVDDSGGVGHDATVVRVTGLLNGDFEGGFHVRPEGTVANHWVPYAAGGAPVGTSYLPAAGGGGASFEAEEFVVHDGQRSQKAIASAGSSAGILQPFGANVGWDYQVSAWFHLLGEGKCRLGIDPSGGTDPASSEIAWSEGSPTGYWMLLAGRVTAKRRAVTVFLEVSATTKLTTAWFDGAAIVVTPCELTARPSRPPAKDEEKCVNWRDEKAGQKGKEFTESGFMFKASNTLQVVTYGEPPGEGKLRIPISTLEVALPFEASRVVAHVVQNTGRFVEMKAMDASGQAVGQASSSGARGKVEALEIDAAGMVSLQFTSGGEDTLVDLCAYRRPPVQAETPTIVGGEARPVLTLSVAGEPVGMQRDGGGNGTENDSGGCGCGNR